MYYGIIPDGPDYIIIPENDLNYLIIPDDLNYLIIPDNDLYYELLFGPTPTPTQTPTETIVQTPTPTPVELCTTGSLVFGSGSYLSIPAGNNWVIGTSDFCVEWWQYQTQISPPCCSRVFDVGSYPNESIGLSIESGNLLAWVANGSGWYGNIPLSNYINQWVHIAFVRESGVISVYKDGVRILNTSAPNAITDNTSELTIGYGSSMEWYGKITNFRFVNGYSVYDTSQSTITVPTEPLSAVTGTKLLLLANDALTYIDDSSGIGNIVTNNNGVVWDSSSPNFICPTPVPTPTPTETTTEPTTTTTTEPTTTTTEPTTTTTEPTTTTTEPTTTTTEPTTTTTTQDFTCDFTYEFAGFLQQENLFYILQENGDKIIIT